MTINLATYMDSETLAPPAPEPEERLFAASLHDLTGMLVYAHSISASRRAVFFLCREGISKQLGILASAPRLLDRFEGNPTAVTVAEADCTLLLCPLSAANAAALREVLPFLVPQTLRLKQSAGCGDRLGIATPGHVRAISKSTLAPVFAQQSMRENARTGRTPQEVVDDAVWGIFQEGWRFGYGADADHLKTTEDIDLCVRAGYTLYTFDPGGFVDNHADTNEPEVVEAKVAALPWGPLESSVQDLCGRLAGRRLDLGGRDLTIPREELLRAAAKYGRAVAHTVTMYRHLERVAGSRAFEVEMSVDETESVTTLAEHVYVAAELKRLGVRWVSLAPRYVGTFEKGVDYIGDLAAFKRSLEGHLSVARTFGPYKLSLHSGSDKFSIYPVVADVAGSLIHLKTAGTSYLEALRTLATLNPWLFRQVLDLARDRYPADRASYHVSAETDLVPASSQLSDGELPSLLEDFHAREVLHVTFGSVMQVAELRTQLLDTLRAGEETYYRALADHFRRHFAPFEASHSTQK